MFWSSPAWDSVVYWSLDLETGGFDPRRDPIVSVGMVPVESGVIRLGEGWESLVRPALGGAISEASIQAHQLVPEEVREAPPLPEVLAQIERRMRDSVLLVHHASIDVRFLRHAFQECRMRWPRPHVVDTVDLLLKLVKKERFTNPDARDGDPVLNLAAARSRLGLPVYQSHDALTDAVSAAELFLVLRRRLAARTLRDLR
ncbi:MAG TPA: 3'-5' exonuclease [Anaeromyxobacteraceae bacterium]|nr:3'-5' exonuclease [Anaeromyxobacteraceae bacterium]